MLAIAFRGGAGTIRHRLPPVALAWRRPNCQRLRNNYEACRGVRWNCRRYVRGKMIALVLNWFFRQPVTRLLSTTRDRHYIYREVFCNLFRRAWWSKHNRRSFLIASLCDWKKLFRNICKEKRLRVPRSMIATCAKDRLRVQPDQVDERSINENAYFRFIHKAFAYSWAQQLIGPT